MSRRTLFGFLAALGLATWRSVPKYDLPHFQAWVLMARTGLPRTQFLWWEMNATTAKAVGVDDTASLGGIPVHLSHTQTGRLLLFGWREHGSLVGCLGACDLKEVA